MGLKRKTRKNATLLMLHQRKQMYESGQTDTPAMTAYKVASWHGIAQSSA